MAPVDPAPTSVKTPCGSWCTWLLETATATGQHQAAAAQPSLLPHLCACWRHSCHRRFSAAAAHPGALAGAHFCRHRSIPEPSRWQPPVQGDECMQRLFHRLRPLLLILPRPACRGAQWSPDPGGHHRQRRGAGLACPPAHLQSTSGIMLQRHYAAQAAVVVSSQGCRGFRHDAL